ncbi:Kinesin-like protein kif21b [Dinochytrium kinnereticum]|nr:Kinesin-like protein kif21b [Dinochytrium kinnereticum]
MSTITTVKVAVRVRPLNAKEILSTGTECVRIVPNLPQIVVGLETSGNHAPGAGVGHNNFASRSFTFDEVFGPESTQAEVYDVSLNPLVERFLEGFNSTALAYGQTGSGKTWSMGTGLDSASVSPEQQGIVPRAISEIFSKLEARKDHCPHGFKYIVAVSFMELYNEDLVDLLNPRPRTAGGGGGPTIREDSQGNIVWGGVREEDVSSPDELISCLQRGSLCRATGSTDMNASSSRSHAIFSVILKQQIWTPLTAKSTSTTQPAEPAETTNPGTDTAQDTYANDAKNSKPVSYSPETHPDGAWRQLTSKFHFVDLAGSERLKRTNAEGDRKKEGISINQGLLALGNVISALGDESRKVSHVPYRDSKLTRMLQDSLGGNSQTLMLACISPSDSNYGETVNTLNYANRARNIRNRVVVNQEFFGAQTGGGGSAAEVRALRALVADLREEVASLRGGTGKVGATQAAMDAAVVSRERQIQLHLQSERDLSAKLEISKSELRVAQFDLERLGFKCNRLAERGRDMADELASTTAERDAALIELQKWRSGRLSLSNPPLATTITSSTGLMGDEVTSPDKPVPTSPSGVASPTLAATTNTDFAMVASYNRTISDLRFQLSEAEDRLAWYNEVMAELEGKKKSSASQRALRAPFDPALDRPADPRFALVEAMRGTEVEVAHEGRLVKALKSDPELGKVLSQETEKAAAISELDNLKLYGLPRISTTSWRPSSLGNEENNNSDEDDFSDNEEDGEEEQPMNERSRRNDDPAVSRRSRSSLDGMNRMKSGRTAASAGTNLSDRSADMFLLIHRLQGDIADHQAIVDRLSKRDQEYEAMRGAYEAKLAVLQTQVAAIARERDEALKRMKDPGAGNATGGLRVGGGERVGSAAIRARFDDERRKLEFQISDLRKKLMEGARMQTSSKGRTDSLTKQLMTTIDALKMEKAKMLKELKKENEKNRSLKTEKEREIARLRRKEKTAAEIAKKLERSNQLQRLMIKRRSEEMVNSHSKLKSVMSLLKRTSGGSAGSGGSTKVQKQSGAVSPTKRPRSRQYRAPTPNMITKDSFKVTTADDIDRPRTPPPEVRAKFKRQMIEKEVASVVNSRLTEIELNNHKAGLEKLIGEQRELMAERDRCVAADAERTGVYAPHLPQYMDERLGVLDLEIAMANARIKKVEQEMKLGRTSLSSLSSMVSLNGNLPGSAPMSPPSYIPSLTDGELSWENAMNLLRSLDHIELEYISSMLLDDIVTLRVNLRMKDTAISDHEKQVTDLRMSLQTMRGAALKTAMEYRKELEEVRTEAARRIAAASGSSPPSKVVTPPTPRIQKMFDAAYGQGVVVIAPSLSRQSYTEEPDSFATVEPKDSWNVEQDNNAIFDPKKRGIAPAAAAALKSMRESVELKSAFNDDSNGLPIGRNHSPTRSSSLTASKNFASTPPRGKAAAEAAAIGAAAAALAKIADLEQYHSTRRRSDNEPLARDRPESPSAHKLDTEDDMSIDSSPPRGRQGRFSPDSSASQQQPVSKSPSRRATDGKDVALKKTANIKRGPPLSPRSSSVSVASSTQSLTAGLPPSNSTFSPPSVTTGTNNSLSPTRGEVVGRVNSGSRKRSPSWTYGRDSPSNSNPHPPASIINHQVPRRKASTPAFSINSSSSSMIADEVEEEEVSGWQMFGMQTQNAVWGGTASRPQSRAGKSNKENVESPDSLSGRLSKKRSSSPLGRPPSTLPSSGAQLQPNHHHLPGDVFTRLASSHTLASQAKVIHRERDYTFVTDPTNAVTSHAAASRKPPLASEPPYESSDAGKQDISVEHIE